MGLTAARAALLEESRKAGMPPFVAEPMPVSALVLGYPVWGTVADARRVPQVPSRTGVAVRQ